MYSGFNKGDGAIIGPVAREDNQVDFEETSDISGGEEAIVFVEETEDGEASLAVAAARVNPATGALLWTKVDYNTAMIRTISMSQMSSMLNDFDRNSIYMQAIKKCIDYYVKVTGGKYPSIVDIGSGTGLLSMAAAKYGARKLLSCEMFTSLAGVSESVIADNGFDSIIQVVAGKSSDLDLEGMEEDSLDRPDIVISEILDSALLGESCMLSHSDAITRLLSTADSGIPGIDIQDKVVPHSGEVYAHLIECPEIAQMVNVAGLDLQGANPWKSSSVCGCRGGWPLIPLHWQVYEKNYDGKYLSSADKPTKVLSVDFYTPVDQSNETGGGHSMQSMVSVTRSGVVHGVLLWWKVRLCSPAVDPDGHCVLHTAPPSVFSALQSAGDPLLHSQLNWQDHWVQVVYPLPEALTVATGQAIRINASHDCIHIWMDVTHSPSSMNENATAVFSETVFSSSVIKRARLEDAETEITEVNQSENDDKQYEEVCSGATHESCVCGWHMLHGSERMQALSDPRRSQPLAQMVNTSVDKAAKHAKLTGKKQFVVDVSDGSILSLVGLRRMLKHSELDSSMDDAGGVALVSLETKLFSELFYRKLLATNAREQDDVRVWNSTEDFTCIEQWMACEEENAAEGGEVGETGGVAVEHEQAEEEEEEESSLVAFAAKYPECRIACLMSECFYYQMSIQPTWSALAFYYKRIQLDPLLVVSNGESSVGSMTSDADANANTDADGASASLPVPGSLMNTVISPRQGRIMVAAVDCERLFRCHGPVGMVNGVFDHKAYDAVVQNWHEHCYPYKLGHYDKRVLTRPTCIGTLDYYRSKSELEGTSIDSMVDIPITIKGSNGVDGSDNSNAICHFIAIWVDYQLTEDDTCTLELYRSSDNSKCAESQMDFPIYSTVYIKFLPVPVKVTNASILKAGVRFAHGDSDFKYDFSVV